MDQAQATVRFILYLPYYATTKLDLLDAINKVINNSSWVHHHQVLG